MFNFNFSSNDWLSDLHKIATIFIAIFNLFFSFYIFYFNNKKGKKDKEKDINVTWMKNLVLDHSLDFFHSFFNDIKNIAEEIEKGNISEDKKIEINEKLLEKFVRIRYDFVDYFLAVDSKLYTSILTQFDELQDELTALIFSSNFEVEYQEKFNRNIIQKLSNSRTNIIKILFSYRGIPRNKSRNFFIKIYEKIKSVFK